MRFCELCARRGLVSVTLATGQDDGDSKTQVQGLEEIKRSLASCGIVLSYSFDSSLHDRDVAFDNGWVVRLGRGLDYFKRLDGVFVLGAHDYNLRPCHPVNIDIWQDVVDPKTS